VEGTGVLTHLNLLRLVVLAVVIVGGFMLTNAPADVHQRACDWWLRGAPEGSICPEWISPLVSPFVLVPLVGLALLLVLWPLISWCWRAVLYRAPERPADDAISRLLVKAEAVAKIADGRILYVNDVLESADNSLAEKWLKKADDQRIDFARVVSVADTMALIDSQGEAYEDSVLKHSELDRCIDNIVKGTNYQSPRHAAGLYAQRAKKFAVSLQTLIAELNSSRPACIDKVKRPKRRAHLSVLRTEGVAIRNKGQRLKSDFPTWEVEVATWASNVIQAIAAIDEADAEWFKTLDTVPPPRLPILTPFPKHEAKHLKIYREHDYRIVKLDQIIQRYGAK